MQHLQHHVDIVLGVVHAQRSSDRRFETVPAKNGLGAVMPKADSDPLLIQRFANLVVGYALDYERQHPCLLRRRAKQP
jgi:hypothetical protein